MTTDRIPVEGIFECDDGGSYYFRQVDVNGPTVLAMYGEHPELDFCRVMDLTLLNQSDPDEANFEGGWWDVSKGRSCTKGRLTLRTFRLPDGTRGLRLSDLADGSDPFRGREWKVTNRRAANLIDSRPRRPFFQGDGWENLSGRWISQTNGGTYYINQIAPSESRTGRSGTMAWYAERARGIFGQRTEWAHILIGPRRTDGVFTGRYFDIPKGRTRGSGNVNITPQRSAADFVTALTIENTNGPTNQREIIPDRVRGIDDPYRVTFSWPRFEVAQTNEDWLLNKGDEPFLDVFILKFDGSLVRLDDLADATLEDISFRTAELGDDIRSGAVLTPVPHMEEIELDIVPIEGAPTSRAIAGLVIMAHEADQSGAIDHEPTRHFVQNDVVSQLRSGADPDLSSVPSRYLVRHRSRNQHDLIGTDRLVISIDDLDRIAASGASELVTMTFEGEDAEYNLTVAIDVEAPLVNDCTTRRHADDR